MLPFPHNPYHPSKSRFRQTFSDNFPQTLACHDSVYAKAMGIIFNWYNGFIKLVEMKSFIRFWLLVLAVSYTCTHVFAQKNNKVFYKENFASEAREIALQYQTEMSTLLKLRIKK